VWAVEVLIAHGVAGFAEVAAAVDGEASAASGVAQRPLRPSAAATPGGSL